MVKAKSSGRIALSAVSFLLGALLLLGSLSGLTFRARADEDEQFFDYATTPVEVTNTQFDDSGSYPVSPNGWTLSALDGAQKGNTKSGVVNLEASSFTGLEKDKTNLHKYPEYAGDVPVTPFGKNTSFPNTNQKVLMVNTDGSSTAVGYTSSSFTLEPNSYYSVSVYVKTGDFGEGTGASVKLDGVNTKGDKDDPDSVKELAFYNINTVADLPRANGLPVLTKDNLYGFKKYTFYVETSYVSSTATLVLSVGAKATNEDKGISYYYPANGYAFFDNVEVNRLSPIIYRHETSSLASGAPGVEVKGTSMVAALNASTYIDGGDFNDATKWTRTEKEDVNSGNAEGGVHNANSSYSDASFHFTADPVSPIGRDADEDRNIFVISSYNSSKDSYDSVAVGYRSTDITVKRHSYTRISVWAKTQDVEGGNGASVAVVGEDIVNDTEDHTLEKSQTVTGDESNASRYGWKEFAFYLKGSALSDYTVHLELRLGAKDSLTKGMAMFGEIRAEEITYTEYTDNSTADTQVTFDGTFADTGVSNGLFFNAGDYSEYKYPLAPADWTLGNPKTVTTTGFSTEEVESAEDVVSGIIPTDPAHFDARRGDYNYAVNPDESYRGNVLMISSLKPTAVCYTSPSLTVTASKNYSLTVSLKTDRIEGYGASLVLKDDGGNVLSTIENITGTDQLFRDYTFYIEGSGADKTVTVELWLGLNDRRDNTTKLSSGELFVKKVSLTEITDATALTAKADGYTQALINGTVAGGHRIRYSYYSFKSENFTAYDAYDTNVVKTAYNWKLTAGDTANVTYGIFNATSIPANQTEIPAGFQNGDSETPGVLYLRNNTAAYSRIESSNTYSLAENTYHKLTVRLKVDIPEDFVKSGTAIGAGVELTGTDYKFKDIRSTALVEDQTINGEYYREYTFYIKADAASSVGVAVTLGGNEFTNQNCAGRVYVNSIVCQEIGNTDYEMKIAELAELEKNDETDPYSINAVIASADEPAEEPSDPDEPGNSLQWWLIPSILFAVAIVIAVVGFGVRRFVDKRAKRKTTEKISEYDRRITLHKQHNELAEESEKLKDVQDVPANDTVYDTFDDTSEPIVKKKPEASATETTVEQSSPEAPSAENEQPVTETAATGETEAEKPEEKKEPASTDAYTDEFDD